MLSEFGCRHTGRFRPEPAAWKPTSDPLWPSWLSDPPRALARHSRLLKAVLQPLAALAAHGAFRIDQFKQRPVSLAHDPDDFCGDDARGFEVFIRDLHAIVLAAE